MMEICVITFRSVTPAQRGESVLKRAGYVCSIRRTPRWMESRGCGYSVQVKCDRAQDCVALLQENRVTFRKVYLQRSGRLEEMTL